MILFLIFASVFYGTDSVPPPLNVCYPSPVCGSDGTTYTNLNEINCVAKCIKDPFLKLVSYGKCVVPLCICPMIFKPVCGNNGVTYVNDCDLACAAKRDANIEKILEGECSACIKAAAKGGFKPVCGSDGRTYFNAGILKCAAAIQKLTIVSTGRCPCIVTKDLNPVCGTNGLTYPNLSYLKCEMKYVKGLGLKYAGVCKSTCIKCIKPVAVCGTDHVTYPNACALNCKKNNGFPNLNIAFVGVCKDIIG